MPRLTRQAEMPAMQRNKKNVSTRDNVERTLAVWTHGSSTPPLPQRQF